MRRRRGRWILLAALLGLFGAAGSVFTPREKRLLDRSQEVACLRDREFHWLSDREALVLREAFVPGQDSPSQWIFSRLDILTGNAKPIPFLSKLPAPNNRSVGHISPDGKWLLWKDGGVLNSVTAVQLETGVSHNWGDFWNGGRAEWLADSRHWIWIGRDFGVGNGGVAGFLHDIQKPDVNQEIELFHKIELGDITAFNTASHLLVTESLLSPDTERSASNLSEWQFIPDARRLRTSTIILPFPACIQGQIFSPAGDKIAWHLLKEQNTSSLWTWLHRRFSFIPAQRRTIESLWVSDLNGSRWQEIGTISAGGRDESGNESGALSNLEWIPGGKRLSFTYKDRIYTVPAD